MRRAARLLFSGFVVIAVLSCAPGATVMDARADARAISFADLPGWADDDHAAALATFARSCTRIAGLDASAPLDSKTGTSPIYGRAGDWQPACAAALQTVAPGSARGFFEHWFQPVRLAAERGLLTGYYEPEMRGALTRHGPYQTPVLAPPPGFAMRAGGAGFPTRAEIEDGALDHNALALIWLESPVDAFFLHVQGSGRVRLENGETVRLAFAAKSGHEYTSIGKVLIDRGAIPREEVSMQTIRAWMEANPVEGRDVMRQNQSYIFFRILRDIDPELGPPGAEGVNLTPRRSLAIDRAHHPLGALFWLTTRHPTPDGRGEVPFAHLVVAQDTGSAIKGVQRGDIFFGSGDEPGEIAGRMKAEGELTALVPKTIAPR
ncbi:MAG: MltA domain-containing protein [Parvibaculum sp.]|uniref:murein transglycosylase A n=1 Tax=Parvibaculum sp. TaxID=2024848 RepID=UPI001D48A9F2|nr:MltA domain-containing protein [Parvibaculum sp.]MBX3489749.1 MltA domain-containing protein [Parvibaculum sp.]MBX3494801.1 MltA domain-containing protein [Parvibaculum sp.]MCW5726293.1 MltA domain-containing protein [Parvibaculum sp.]